jgi:hypothetical protein
MMDLTPELSWAGKFIEDDYKYRMTAMLEIPESGTGELETYAELIIVDGKTIRATKQNSRNRRCKECGCVCYQCPIQHACCTMTVCCSDK